MSRTTTIPVDLQRLKSCGKNGVTIIQLMMAFNDMCLANHCFSEYRKELPPSRKHVQRGARMYFIRLEWGHLNEAMKIIKKINNDTVLSDTVARCSQKAQNSLRKLINCSEGQPGNDDFKKYIGKLRDKITFHYNTKKISKALSDRASRPEAARSMITLGDHRSLHRFGLADDIVDSIVCRQIWKIPRKTDLRQEADRIAVDYISDLSQSFITFAGEFAARYIEENAHAR